MIQIWRLSLEARGCSKLHKLLSLAECKKLVQEMCIALDVTMIGMQAFDVGAQHSGAEPGVTVNVTFLESHLALHTWPEYRFVAIEIASCKYIDRDVIVEMVEIFFAPASLSISQPTMEEEAYGKDSVCADAPGSYDDRLYMGR